MKYRKNGKAYKIQKQEPCELRHSELSQNFHWIVAERSRSGSLVYFVSFSIPPFHSTSGGPSQTLDRIEKRAVGV